MGRAVTRLGILLILVFSMWLRVLPSSGTGGALHLIMPAITLGTAIAGSLARFTRSSLLEVLNKNYMRAAAAKGVPRSRRIAVHALPNAAIPLLTVLGFRLGDLVAGLALVEFERLQHRSIVLRESVGVGRLAPQTKDMLTTGEVFRVEFPKARKRLKAGHASLRLDARSGRGRRRRQS